MYSRERVIRSICFEKPDRIPTIHRIKYGYYKKYGSNFTKLIAAYPPDIVQSEKTHTWFTYYSNSLFLSSGYKTMKDEWGCVWANNTENNFGQVIESPITDWRDYDNYNFPSPTHGKEGIDEMVEVRKMDKSQHYFMFWIGSIFHTYTYIRGMYNAMLDVVEENQKYYNLLERLLDFQIKRIDLLKHAKPDGILISDDWGTQNSMMINPNHWRKIFKPIYSIIVDKIHKTGTFAHFHTCGNTLPILEDLIECGFDEINPQVQLMNRNKIASIFKNRCCIRPDLDRQNLLVNSNPTEVSMQIKDTFKDFASPTGGYIGHIPVETSIPIENVEAMLQTYWDLSFTSEVRS